MSSNETIKKTLTVTVVLSLVCSVMVSVAAVALKGRQDENKQLDVQQNILTISGLVPDAKSLSREEIQDQFKNIQPRLVDLRAGRFYSDGTLNAETFDQREAAKKVDLSARLSPAADIASIRRQSLYGKVYVVEESDQMKTLILPIHGYGLWSTMYGFMALDRDLKTVVGMGFYEHGETPGLGGEVDNSRWKSQWIGKQVLDTSGRPDVQVVKGSVDSSSPQAIHQVDGLSGATLTSRGVENLVNFWLGDNGFGPFLANLKKGEA